MWWIIDPVLLVLWVLAVLALAQTIFRRAHAERIPPKRR